MKASEWAFDRIKEAFEKVAQDEAEKVSIVQEIMLISTDYLRPIIAPVEGQSQCLETWIIARSSVSSQSNLTLSLVVKHVFTMFFLLKARPVEKVLHLPALK